MLLRQMYTCIRKTRELRIPLVPRGHLSVDNLRRQDRSFTGGIPVTVSCVTMYRVRPYSLICTQNLEIFVESVLCRRIFVEFL